MAASQKLDVRAEYAASSYIRREHRKLFTLDDEPLFQNIPDGICVLCALYFGSRDYFEIIPDTEVSLSNDNMTATKVTAYSKGETSFGSLLIPSTSQCISQWDIKIDCFNHCNTILIGISSEPFDPYKYFHDPTTNKLEDPTNHHAYVYGLGGQNRSFQGETWEVNGRPFHSSDVVAVRLDLKKKEVKFYVNEIYSNVTFEIETGDNIEYRLAVALFDEGNQITLTKFEQWY